MRDCTLVAETVQVPQMAESITEGTLKTWLKQVGDTVAADEEIASIETDKVKSDSFLPQSFFFSVSSSCDRSTSL
jgi:2-oxoglutarate dehydrogenase E2 component (dihydrolipoamide succinyltransferase)